MLTSETSCPLCTCPFLQNDDVIAHTSSLVGNPRPQSGDCPTAPCKRVAAVAIQVVGDVLLVIGDVV